MPNHFLGEIYFLKYTYQHSQFTFVFNMYVKKEIVNHLKMHFPGMFLINLFRG